MTARLVGMVVTLVLIATLAGCGLGEQAVRVAYTTQGRAELQKHWDLWAAAFARTHPGWRLEQVDMGPHPPDFYRHFEPPWADVLMPLGYYSQLLRGGHLQALPAALQPRLGLRQRAHPGPYYRVQVGRRLAGIAVNKRMWREAGIVEPPLTWDEWYAALHRLAQVGYQPLAYGSKDISAAVPLSYAIQVDLYSRQRAPDQDSWTVRRNRGEVSFATSPTTLLILQKMVQLVNGFTEKRALYQRFGVERDEFLQQHAATWMVPGDIAAQLQQTGVEFEIEYWPIPSMLDEAPVFIEMSRATAGWAVSSGAAQSDQAGAALQTLYEPEVYQAYIDAQGLLGDSTQVGQTLLPQSAWPATQFFYASMERHSRQWGATPGYNISQQDRPPPGFDRVLARVMRDILTGNRDQNQLLKMLDQGWDWARQSQL